MDVPRVAPNRDSSYIVGSYAPNSTGTLHTTQEQLAVQGYASRQGSINQHRVGGASQDGDTTVIEEVESEILSPTLHTSQILP